MEKNYYRKGARVIYHFRKWQQVLWSNSGWGLVEHWKQAMIILQPRDDEGKFTNDFTTDWCVNVRLRDEDGKIIDCTLEDIEPDIAPCELSFDELKKLYGEISHGSIFYDDYKNSLGVFQNTAYDYYEGFWTNLVDEYGGEEEAEKHDNAEEFAEYCQGCEYLQVKIAA